MTSLFLGGIPTGPDVKLLAEAFDPIEPGDEFTHDAMEKVLSIKRDSARYRSVTDAWRRDKLRDENVEIVALPRVGFRALTPNERVDENIKGFRYGTRKQARSVNRIARVKQTEDLDAIHRQKQDHMLRSVPALLEAARKVVHEIQPPKPAAQLSHMKKPDEPRRNRS